MTDARGAARPLRLATVARAGASLALAVAWGGLVAGCAQSSAVLPGDLRVEVLQNRTDYAAGRMQVRVINASDEDVVVSEVAYNDPRFESDAVWTGDSEVRGGITRDLPVQIPVAICPPGVGSGTARLTFAVADRDGVATVEVTDPLEMVGRVTEEQCSAAAVASAAEVAFGASVEFSGSGADEVALVPLTVSTISDVDVTVDSVGSTVLLQPEGGADSWPLDQRIPGESTSTIVLPVVPARCDPHAVAEDKVGTRFPLTMTVGDQTSEITLVMPSEVRALVFEYIGRRCGSA
ncbi:hypothetical protein ACFSBZ_12335 [Amnibacterium flavum]|uniref:Uncharacterized protein n=1 Tax=Amnibacterium flavum TaxID=2173173 RepID=A0A2V1HTB9_9MICO|nr:hypothetical protein [Amnibacterium flavum]PVZ95581.1 hypothetical protein DDQ50_03540 [Amnibacterium flavum]